MKSNKNEMSDYAPWELEDKDRKEPGRKGIPPINQKSQTRSKPKGKDQAYLEMYILAREKERLEKYGTTLGRRLKSISAMWKETKARMYELQRNAARIGKEGIKELMRQEKEKKEGKKKKKTQGKMQGVDWEY